MSSRPGSEPQPEFGKLITGTVEAVFRWGVIVDLALDHVGLIDALYIEDGDECSVGQSVTAYLEIFDEQKNEYMLRPPGQISLSERLKHPEYPFGNWRGRGEP